VYGREGWYIDRVIDVIDRVIDGVINRVIAIDRVKFVRSSDL
jgi:hypothetical protein